MIFQMSLEILYSFDLKNYYFQHIVIYKFDVLQFNISYCFGIDGISLSFILLTTFLTLLCMLFMWEDNMIKEYGIILLIIELCLIIIFSVLDILLFYIFFEAILIPMFLLIGFFGSRERKIRAAYLLFFYTIIGSLFFLVGILYIYYVTGTFNIEYINLWSFTKNEQYFLWIAFFLSFAFKIPMFPFHAWLPEAHVEAPTVGSVLLAGVLLKLGVYGFIRFSLVLFPEACLYFEPLIILLSLLGIIYTSLTAIRQTDFKRIIAYSSIAHMNLIMLGLFSFNYIGLEGSILQSLSHGFVSGALFFLIGIIYIRYHTRLIYYYGGIAHKMPYYVSFFFLFTLANIALPGTSSFVGEFLILNGVFQNNSIVCFLSTTGVILCGIYSLWLYNRISFGNLKILGTKTFNDLNFREIFILSLLLIFVFILGLKPIWIAQYFKLAIYKISLYYNVYMY